MTIHESVDRVLDSKNMLGTSFYEVFFKMHPEVQQFFTGIDMQRQAVVLTMALIVIEQFYSNPFPATRTYLQYLGTQHEHRKIPKDMYPKWKEAMLFTLKKFHGHDWTDELAQHWAAAIDRTTDVMFEGYAHHYTV